MKKLSVRMTRKETLWGWIFLVLQLFVLPTILVFINVLAGSPLSASGINFLFFCIDFLCTVLIFWRFLGNNGKNALRSVFLCLRSAFFGFIGYWLLSFVISIFIVTVYPNFANVNDQSINTLVQENASLISFGTVLLVPITEEVLYRGLIFQGLYNRSRFAAYAVSTLAFAALHIISYIGLYEPLHLLLCLLQYLPAGLCLGWAYARADSIWAPILMHIAINQIAISAMR